MASPPVKVESLVYQSGNISLQDWVSLFTLCLAPLLVHIISGAPQPVYLSRSRPTWHNRLCHYNPTSIIWRYAAITDRRIRAREWSPVDIAAANALFYTPKGWDGSEEMAARSLFYCVALPDKTRVDLFSWPSIKTAIVTLQGVQSLYYILKGTFDPTHQFSPVALDNVFFPIATFGLLRLYAAFWLTEDFIYGADSVVPLEALSDPYLDLSQSYMRTSDSNQLLDRPSSPTEARFHSSSYWPSRLFRVFFFSQVFALSIFSVRILVLAISDHKMYSMTSIILNLGGIVFFTTSTIIYIYYSIRFGCKSTIIPCISSGWYKIYTGFSVVVVLTLIIVSAIETRKTPCGQYTTGTRDFDRLVCPGLIYIEPDSDSRAFGLATGEEVLDNSLIPDGDRFVVVSFIGWCQGVNGSSNVAVFTNASSTTISL